VSALARFLGNRNFIFMAALGLGLFAPRYASSIRSLIMPTLALTMVLSTMGIGSEIFRRPRMLLRPALLGILMNYLILGAAILILGALLIDNKKIWAGVVLLAAVPPAVAVMPFSDFLHGDSYLSLTGTIGAFIGGLFFMPLITFTLLSPDAFDPLKLLLAAFELILLPLAVSRILIRKGWHTKIAPWKGHITNWSFFLIMYTLVGLNSPVFLRLDPVLPAVAFIAFSTNFLLGLLIEWGGRFLEIAHPQRISLVLLGTLKNQGMAGGLALALFGSEAAIPAAVCTASMVLYIVWLDVVHRNGKNDG
jgi:BASS family bile acid:Na+ symporter